jgi:hypothetical protein
MKSRITAKNHQTYKTMYTGLMHAHSGLAYLLLAALIFAIVYNLIGFMGNKPFTEGNRKIAMIGLIATHIQVVIGLVLYFVSPNGLNNFSGGNMKDSAATLADARTPAYHDHCRCANYHRVFQSQTPYRKQRPLQKDPDFLHAWSHSYSEPHSVEQLVIK